MVDRAWPPATLGAVFHCPRTLFNTILTWILLPLLSIAFFEPPNKALRIAIFPPPDGPFPYLLNPRWNAVGAGRDEAYAC